MIEFIDCNMCNKKVEMSNVKSHIEESEHLENKSLIHGELKAVKARNISPKISSVQIWKVD
jgi:hypothetical protein